MKIDLPVIEHTLKVLVKSPEGKCVKVLDDSHRSFEINLPDSVIEDEVEVMACHLDERGLAVGDMFCLKEAIKPKEKDDEDASVKADEETAKSPPAKVAKKVKPVDLSKRARNPRG